MSVNVASALSSYKKALEANKAVISAVNQNYKTGSAVSDFSAILKRIDESDDSPITVKSNIKTSPITSSNNGFLNNIFGKFRSVIGKSEEVSAKAMHHQASLTDVATAVAEADMALQTITALRDKVIAAYQDVMKMPI